MKQNRTHIQLCTGISLMLLGAASASGQIILTVDNNAHRFSWSGSATSIAYTITEGSFVTFALGNGGSVAGIAFGGDGSVSVGSTFGSLFNQAGDRGNLIVNTPGGLVPQTIATPVGTGFAPFESGDATGTITLSGDGAWHSLFIDPFTSSYVEYLEAHNGTPLFFLAGSTFNMSAFGEPVGSIIVVPEPGDFAAATALGLLAFASWRGWMRRQPNAV